MEKALNKEVKLENMRFDVLINDVKPTTNPLFSKAKARILYTGKNRNMSYFTKETIDKMLPTLFNIPVIGEFVEKKEDFGTHGGKVEISDQGINYIETTKPYGVVPSDAEIGWETVTEKDGTEREYLYCSLYLWTGRYPEALQVVEGNENNQSMEIAVNEYDWNEEGQYYEIKDAIFSALCILGKDVEPCFESANITGYQLNKEQFKLEFTQMLAELKLLNTPSNQNTELELDTNFNINNNKEGGNNMEEKLQLFVNYPTLTEEMVADLKTNLDTYTVEELELKLKELFDAQSTQETTEEVIIDETVVEVVEKVETVEVVESDSQDNEEFTEVTTEEVVVEPTETEKQTVGTEKGQIIFELSHEDIRWALHEVINPIKENGERDYNYWIINVFQTYFIAQDAQNYDNYFKYPYSISENDEPTVGTPVPVIMQWVEAGNETTDGTYELTELENLKQEVEDLRAFKAKIEKAEKQTQVDELFASFIEFANEPDYQALLVEAIGMEISTLEEKLFALAGRKKFSFVKKEVKKDTTKIVVVNTNIETDPYGAASKYFNKE